MWNKWYVRHKRKLKRMGAITLIAAAVLYGLCFYMSYKAADIFSKSSQNASSFPVRSRWNA